MAGKENIPTCQYILTFQWVTDAVAQCMGGNAPEPEFIPGERPGRVSDLMAHLLTRIFD